MRNYPRHLLQTWDLSLKQIETTLVLAQQLQRHWIKRRSCRIFKAGLAVSWFRDKSTRTRLSFKSAANLLGLAVQDLDEEKSQLAHGETIRETANMISFLTEVIGIRDDKYLEEGHKFQESVIKAVEGGYKERVLPQIPTVINLQSDRDHPTQSLADLLHLKNYFGSLRALKGKKLVMSWAYSPTYGKPLSVAQGTTSLMSRLGMNLVLAYPKGYHLIPELEQQAAEFSKKSGGSFIISHNMNQAFDQADIVYPKSWASFSAMEQRVKLYRQNDLASIAQLEKRELKENAQYRDWECNEEKMTLTKNGRALYLHCLPADISGINCQHGEVSAEVFERYRAETFKQAGYKLFIIAAMIILAKGNKK